MKLIYTLSIAFLSTLSVTYAQVGIGTNAPRAFFHVIPGQTVLFGADTSGGTGFKMIWYGTKGAFRAGGATYFSLSPGDQWNYDKVGYYSFASGSNTTASGTYSMAMGYRTVASAEATTALGYYTTASGAHSTALGAHVSTNGRVGSFIIGDASSNNPGTFSDNDHQFMARFAGGYKFFTTGEATIGVQLESNGNAWTTLSDSTRKENFRAVDGAAFLQKIAAMRLGSWNYKGQDAKTYRHYGPMAQDFFAAFGRDGVGTIGHDKAINQADFDGVNLIAIQALIQKVEKLEAENKALRTQNETFGRETASLRADVEAIKQLLNGTAGK